jgi:DNA-damage-inducible protein J
MPYNFFTLLVFGVTVMSAVNFNMRLDAELKDKVTPILENYGLTMPQAFKLFLNQIAKTKTIPLSFDYASENSLTPKAAAKLLQSLKEVENGEYTEYKTVEKMIKAVSEESRG